MRSGHIGCRASQTLSIIQILAQLDFWLLDHPWMEKHQCEEKAATQEALAVNEYLLERQPECKSVLYKQSPSRSKCCLCGNNSDFTDANKEATCFCIACSVTNWHQPLLIMVWNVYLRNSDTNTGKFLHDAFYMGESERKEKLLLRLAGGTKINGSGIRVSGGTKGENPVSWSN